MDFEALTSILIRLNISWIAFYVFANKRKSNYVYFVIFPFRYFHFTFSAFVCLVIAIRNMD